MEDKEYPDIHINKFSILFDCNMMTAIKYYIQNPNDIYVYTIDDTESFTCANDILYWCNRSHRKRILFYIRIFSN